MADTPHPAEVFDLVVGLDTEFVRNNGRDVLPDEDPGNNVLCYSAAILNPRTGCRGSSNYHLRGTDKRNRITFPSFLGKVLTAAEKANYIDTPDGKLRQLLNGRKDAIRIAVVAHFSRADLCGFRDFKSLKTRLDAPRGTFATTNMPAVFNVRLPGCGRSRRVSVTFFDSKLLSPAGCSSLKKLGAALGFPKLTVPDVVDETGTLVKGITRMDLVRELYPEEFELYARRDAEVAVAWLIKVGDYCQSVGLSRIPATLGAIAVAFIKSGDAEVLAGVLGREITVAGAVSKEVLPELAAHQTLMADAFHGGRNECYSVGLYGPEDSAGQDYTDIDLSGAYTCALAFCCEIDWQNVESTKDLDRLATLDAMTFAAVDFRFPEDTRFPSLPCDSGDFGLVFPLSGSSVVTGPELVVARNQGAEIIIRAGVRLNFLDVDGPRPFARTAQEINKQRAAAQTAAGGVKGSALELVAKEVGNSGYGKTAQAVCAMKSQPEIRRQFNSRNGKREPIGPSFITAPHVAAYASAGPRAVVSEMLANTPDDAVVLSVTTDGVLSSMSMEEAQGVAQGPVCDWFKGLRTLVDSKGSPEILETKHVARRVLSVKTRGNFSVETAEIKPGVKSPPLCARAGHRLEAEVADRFSEDKPGEVAEWVRRHAEREFDTKLRGSVFASIQEQWLCNSDLIDIETEVRMNFDFDMKRRPVNVRAGPDGLIKFETVPWETPEESLEWRRDFDAWRIATRSVLKTLADWARYVAWRSSRRTRSAGQRSPWQQHLLVRFATGQILPLRPRGRTAKTGPSNAVTLSQIVTLLSDAGVPAVTRDIVKMAARREAAVANSCPPPLIHEDISVIENLRRMLSPEALLALAAEIDELRNYESSILMGQPKSQIDISLKDKVDTPPTIEINLNGSNSVEGRVGLTHLLQPETPPSPTPQNTPAGANEHALEQPAETAADAPAETFGTNGATPTAPPPPPALSQPTRPADPRHASATVTSAMQALVPLIEARLRRQGVTSKHLRLGRAAAIADGETDADLPMATLVHALALKDGLPPEFAVAVIAGLVTALTSIAPANPKTPMRTA